MSWINLKTEGALPIPFYDAVVGFFQAITDRITISTAKRGAEEIRKQFNIETRTDGRNVDYIRLDYPAGRSLETSKDSTFCFHIVYMVTKNSDQCEGRGPMVPHAFFFDLYEALDYLYDIPGVQGRRNAWFASKCGGDYQIEIQIVHDTAMSAHTVNEVANAMESARFDLKRAMETYNVKRDVLEKHGLETGSLKKPKLEDYVGENRRNFMLE